MNPMTELCDQTCHYNGFTYIFYAFFISGNALGMMVDILQSKNEV